MKTARIAIFLAVSAAAAGAVREPDVVVYLHHGSLGTAAVESAEQQATRILDSVGISVVWRLGTPVFRGRAEVVEAVLSERTAEGVHPGALAFARLGVEGGTRIEVLYDRIQATVAPRAVPNLLAHVLVHEIVHLLEGVDRHSETGLMKAQWTPADFRNMRSALPFSSEDITLIRSWSERHKRLAMSAVR